MNICPPMRKLIHAARTHFHRLAASKAGSIIRIARLTANHVLLTGYTLFFCLAASASSAGQRISPNEVSASSGSPRRVAPRIDSCKIWSEISKPQCDERQSIEITNEALRPASVCKATGRIEYIGLIRSHAEQNALPAGIADAVAYIESRYHPEKIGEAGEIGLMQIRPTTAAMLGFQGSDIELATPETNIRYGVTYLAQAWRLAKGNLCRALMKYRAGHGEKRMTLRSVKYCGRAKIYLRDIHSSQAMNFLAHDPLGSISPEPSKIGVHR
jgi:soluble lytic murein transglycosylase-like protein